MKMSASGGGKTVRFSANDVLLPVTITLPDGMAEFPIQSLTKAMRLFVNGVFYHDPPSRRYGRVSRSRLATSVLRSRRYGSFGISHDCCQYPQVQTVWFLWNQQRWRTSENNWMSLKYLLICYATDQCYMLRIRMERRAINSVVFCLLLLLLLFRHRQRRWRPIYPIGSYGHDIHFLVNEAVLIHVTGRCGGWPLWSHIYFYFYF